MKKEITIAVAAMTFISGAVGITAHTTTEDYICDTAGQTPLVINLADEFTQDIIDTQKIESITFSIDCKTNLDPERAYLTQGQIYYYTDGEMEYRNFADLISVEDTEYASVQNVDSICTEITVGTEEHPLNCDINNDITFYWTWITPERLSMYELGVTTTDGMFYKICSEDYYTVEISECMREGNIAEYKADGKRCYPFGNDVNFSITSTYGEGRDWCDHLAWDMIPLSGDGIVYAVESGTVDFAGWENPNDLSQGFGQYVRIENNTSDKWFYYGHLGEIYVEEGQYVEAGTPIATYSDTGYAFGEHLHLEIRDSAEYGGKISPAEYFGLPDEYGEVRIIPDDTDLAIKCISLNKHFEIGNNLGFTLALNCSDNGAVSGGILQWRGDNYRQFLKYVQSSNPIEFESLATKYGINTKYLDKSVEWWQEHDIKENGNEYNFYVELFGTDWASAAEWEFAIQWEKDIIDDARLNGITDERTILLFSRSYNYHSYGGSTAIMRDRHINDFDAACELARNDEYFLKVNETIDLIATNSIKICSLESIRGENG